MNRHTVLHVCLLLVTWSGKSHASQEPGPSSTERNLVAGRTTTYRSTSSSPKIVLNTGENVQPTSYRYQLFVGKSARVLSELENAFATRTLYSNSTQALRDGLFAQLSLSPTEDTAEGPENTSSGKKIEFVVPLTRDAASKLISTEVHESCRISEQYLTRCVPPNYVYRTVPKEALEAKRQKKVSEAKAQSACSTLWTVVDRPCPLLRSSTGVDRPTPHGESVEPHEVAVRLYFPLATDFSQISELDQKCLLHREDEYQNDLIFHPDLTLPVYYAFGWYRIGVEEAFMVYHQMASDEKSFQHVSVGQLFNVTATMQPRKEDVAGDEKFLQSGLYHRQLSEYLRHWTQRQSVQDPTPWEYRRCDQDANVVVIRSSSAATTPQSPQQEHPWSAHSGFGQDDRETRESQPSEKNHVLYTSFESGCFALGNEDNSGVQMSESESVTKRRSLFVSPLQELQTAFYPIGTASLFTSDKLIPSDAHTILYITGFFVWAALMDLKRESRSANLYLTMFSADGIVMSLHVFELLDSKTRSFNDTTCFTRADETVTCPFLYMVEVLPGTASAQMTYEIIVTLSTTLHATGPSADASRLVAFLQDVVATLYRIPIHVPKHIDQTSEPSNQPIRNHVGDKREGLRRVLLCLAALMVIVGVVVWLRRNQDSTTDNDDKMSRLREVDTEGHREDGMDDAPHSLNMLPGVRCPSTPPPALSVNLPPEK